MALARASIATGAAIHTRIRFEVGDPATDPAGNTRAAGELRFSTTEVHEAVVDALNEMSTHLDAFHPARSLLSVDVTLVDGVGTFTSTIGLSSAALYRVDLLDASGNVEATLAPVPFQALSDWPLSGTYALVGGTDLTVSDVILHVRPRCNETVRVWYIAPPINVASSSDSVPMTDRWREYLVLCAAMKLLRFTGDATDDQRIQLAKLESRFTEFADRVRGPRRARMRDWNYGG